MLLHHRTTKVLLGSAAGLVLGVCLLAGCKVKHPARQLPSDAAATESPPPAAATASARPTLHVVTPSRDAGGIQTPAISTAPHRESPPERPNRIPAGATLIDEFSSWKVTFPDHDCTLTANRLEPPSTTTTLETLGDYFSDFIRKSCFGRLDYGESPMQCGLLATSTVVIHNKNVIMFEWINNDDGPHREVDAYFRGSHGWVHVLLMGSMTANVTQERLQANLTDMEWPEL